MSNKIFKETIIIFLLIVVIIFAMRILFYDSITEDVDDIIEAQYASSEAVEEVLNDIKEKGGEEVKPNTADSLLKSYSITPDDLTGFASDKYYERGKKDPFAESSEKIEQYVTTTVETGTATNSQTSNPIKNTNTISDTYIKNETDVEKEDNNNKNIIKNTINTNSIITNTEKNKKSIMTKNTVSIKQTNTINKISKDKEVGSSKGTFFEDKNLK